ncbi:MAG: YIP1 family protein [Thermodesulfobacteriota bacterium]|nr:YIP1 family protein [Thermodesulfobacteriota bacterium]
MTIALFCPFCSFSRKVPREKIPVGAKWATCPRCGQRFEFPTSENGVGSGNPEAEEAENGSMRQGSPWENRSILGLWQGVFLTFKAVLLSPDSLFRTLTFRGGIREPLAFGLLSGSLGSMFSLFWVVLTWSDKLPSFDQPLFGLSAMALVFIIVLAVIPFLVILGMFISSGILHLSLLIVRGGKNGYEATFRVVSYSQATQAWGLIPFVGGWVGWLWRLIVQIIGLREIHETSHLRVIIALLIPVAVLFLLLIGAVILLLMFIGHFDLGRLWS